MKRFVLAATAFALVAGAAIAQGDPVAQRTTAFKAWGAASREPGAMLRGEAPFELAKVQAFLTLLATDAPKMAALFPDASLGGTTRALPAIATERDKFSGIFTKLEADAKAAAAAVKDEASYKAEMGKVLGNCGACHTPYRKPQ
jgi:cytochrome c556